MKLVYKDATIILAELSLLGLIVLMIKVRRKKYASHIKLFYPVIPLLIYKLKDHTTQDDQIYSMKQYVNCYISGFEKSD
jgi:hypothetical protein